MLRHTPSFAATPSATARWVLPTAALLVWAAVAYSAVSWALRWSATGESAGQSTTSAHALPTLDAAAVARTLGATPAAAVVAPTLASRFQLQGVLAGGASQGAALIAVDGKVAKPFRVGALVSDGLVVQSAQGRRVSLGAAMEGPSTLVLELPVKK